MDIDELTREARYLVGRSKWRERLAAELDGVEFTHPVFGRDEPVPGHTEPLVALSDDPVDSIAHSQGVLRERVEDLALMCGELSLWAGGALILIDELVAHVSRLTNEVAELKNRPS